MNADPRTTWAIDREIVLSRVIAAPRERVFQAWTDPKQIAQWFGPDGFKVESLECDIRIGGRWRSSTPALTARAMTTAWCSCASRRRG